MSTEVTRIEGDVVAPKARKRNGKDVATVEAVQAPASQSDAFLAMIERAARDPQTDIDKMERLFAMSERMRAREAEAAFNASMAAAQVELIPVARNKRNNQTSSNYADLAAIADAAMPIIHKHGFGVSCSEFRSDRPDHLGVACKVTHAAGHSEKHEFHIPWDGAGLKGNANKTPTHAYGSTMSYGRRYATCNIFNIATKDDDGNKASDTTAERITDAQASAILDRIAETEADLAKFLAYWKIDDVAKLPAKSFDHAMALFNQKGRK